MDQRTYNPKRFYLEILLPNFGEIEEEDQQKVICHLLSSCNEQEVLEAIKMTKCIATRETKILKRPGDLVDKQSAISKLFLAEEDVFVDTCYAVHAQRLIRLGMQTTMTGELLKNRAEFLDSKKKCLNSETKEIASELLFFLNY